MERSVVELGRPHRFLLLRARWDGMRTMSHGRGNPETEVGRSRIKSKTEKTGRGPELKR
jgi:hypothetical protein